MRASNNLNNFDVVTVTSEESGTYYQDDNNTEGYFSASSSPQNKRGASFNNNNNQDDDPQQQLRKDPFMHTAPLLRRFAKRAIISRVERTRQEQVAAKASELLVQEQTTHRLGTGVVSREQQSSQRRGTNAFARSGQEPSTGSFQQQGSFFCGRMGSYSDLRASMNMNQSRTNSFSYYYEADFSPNNNNTNSNKITSTNHSIDVTFQALVEELRETVPRSGLPTPDIALIMDRLLSQEVPVHFISHLQKLRHVLREVTRIARSIRRHVELHGDAMVELAEVLDEDAEDEENARELEQQREQEAQQQHVQEMKETMIRERREQGLPTEGDAEAEEELEASITQLEQASKPSWLGNVPRLRSSRPRRDLLERMSQLVQRGDMHATKVIDDVFKWRKHLNCPLPFFHISSGDEDDDDDDDDSFGDDDDDENNNPFLSRHNSASGSSPKKTKQRRRQQHDNVFFLLHRRYGGGMPFNRACDLLRRYAAGEVFFYVSPFDFSVSDEMNQDDGTSAAAMLMREGSLDSSGNFRDDDDEDNEDGRNIKNNKEQQSENNEENHDILLSSTSLKNEDGNESGFLFDQRDHHHHHHHHHHHSQKHNDDHDDDDDESREFATAVPVEGTLNDEHEKTNKKSTTTMNNSSTNRELSPISKSLEFNQIDHKNDAAMNLSKRRKSIQNNNPTQITRARPANLNAGKADMRDKWKRVEHESKLQSKYLRKTLVATAGGWYRPVLKVLCELLWERHTYTKQQAQGRHDRTNTGGSYMRFASKGREQTQPQFHVSSGGVNHHNNNNNFSSTPPPNGNKTQLAGHLYSASAHKKDSDNIYLNKKSTKSTATSSSSAAAKSDPPRTTVAAATEGEEVTLGLDWKHISAGCYIPIVSRDLRTHLIICYRCALAHVARHNPGISASAGTAVQRLIALNASHLARRYLHLWQAALRRRKKLRLQAEQLAVKNLERHKKFRFQTLIKFYNFRNESGRLWRPLLVKCRATLVRRYMHRLFLYRALNIVTRSMRRAVYLRYYRMLHFLVVRRRISAARITFAEEGDTRKKIRQSGADDTREALKELAAASAIGNPMRNLKMKMERYYAGEGDALRVVSEAGGGIFSVPSLSQVIQHGRFLLPFKRFNDAVNVERARIVAEKFLEKRYLIFQFQVLALKSFAESQGIVVVEKKANANVVELDDDDDDDVAVVNDDQDQEQVEEGNPSAIIEEAMEQHEEL